VREGVVPQTYWAWQEVGSTRNAKQELSKIMEAGSGEDLFITPKPTQLIKRMLQIATNNDSLVLDFFAGTGSAAHAVFNLNNEDGGHRKFILVQLPELTEQEDYPAISDITKERVRRVIQKINQEIDEKHEQEKTKTPTLFDTETSENVRVVRGSPLSHLGFRVFKLAESNFKPWNAQQPQDAAALAQQLELHIEHIREGRTSAGILFEILLKSGFPLTTPVETLTLAGKQVFSVAGGALLVCLESELTMEVIRAMAAQKPERVVCLDSGFDGNDQLMANAVQIFKTQGIPSFKTV